MELEILGLGVGAPLGSGCPCYAVSTEATLLLLDFGPGAHERAWERGLLGRIDAIVISHMHLDHLLDLLPLSGEVSEEAIRATEPNPRRPAVYVPRGRGPEVLTGLADALGSDHARFERAFDLREYDDGDELEIGDLRLSFFKTAHAGPCYSPRITDGEGTLVYSADTAFRDELVEHAAGADTLLLESTYLEPGPYLEQQGHMTGEQAADVAERAGARRLVLTHTMPFQEQNEENLRRARARFAGEVELATKGAVFPVGVRACR
jgi:ribonuclease BN (tRNA processing enzyme)